MASDFEIKRWYFDTNEELVVEIHNPSGTLKQAGFLKGWGSVPNNVQLDVAGCSDGQNVLCALPPSEGNYFALSVFFEIDASGGYPTVQEIKETRIYKTPPEKELYIFSCEMNTSGDKNARKKVRVSPPVKSGGG